VPSVANFSSISSFISRLFLSAVIWSMRVFNCSSNSSSYNVNMLTLAHCVEPHFSQQHVKPAHCAKIACWAELGWYTSHPPYGLPVKVAAYNWSRPCSWLGSLTSVPPAAPSRWAGGACHTHTHPPALCYVMDQTTHLNHLRAAVHVGVMV
jgi:hypothetical protein